MLSRLFMHKSMPQPHFAAHIFIVLIAVFTILIQLRPAVGLAGLGTTVLLAAALIEVNRDRIWETYRAEYKRRRQLKGLWHEPNRIYYTINVYMLWPFVAFLGAVCLAVAYLLG